MWVMSPMKLQTSKRVFNPVVPSTTNERILMPKEGASKKACAMCGEEKEYDFFPSPVYANAGVCLSCIKKMLEELLKAQEEKERKSKEEGKEAPPKYPREIMEFLDQYVIGQAEAKKALCVELYKHHLRVDPILKKLAAEEEATKSKKEKGPAKEAVAKGILALSSMVKDKPEGEEESPVEEKKEEVTEKVEVEKSNVLLVGPTGSGKTYIIKTLSKLLDLPFATGDATGMTEAGYTGRKVEDLIIMLIAAADGNIELAQCGVVYLDEVDKIASRTAFADHSRDVGGEGVQQGLLKMIEGGEILVKVPKGLSDMDDGGMGPGKTVVFDTRNVLFIFGGAFSALTYDRVKRLKEKQRTGFLKGQTTSEEVSKKIDVAALIQFGMTPEFMGRIPCIVELEEFSIEDYVKILTIPKNNLVSQYQEIAKQAGINLTFDRKALELIAKNAQAMKTGARSLRSTMEKILRNFFFNIDSAAPDTVITEDMVKNALDGTLTLTLLKQESKDAALDAELRLSPVEEVEHAPTGQIS
jgi:ATP-dependent Clp protease ATP-binding subunit ClpX